MEYGNRDDATTSWFLVISSSSIVILQSKAKMFVSTRIMNGSYSCLGGPPYLYSRSLGCGLGFALLLLSCFLRLEWRDCA
eukprot:1904187-Amphidinium_carterae.1